ncbi:hypothetical protein KB553_09610 [Chryseobacterium rhizoplanae]|uniref:hypothetical protein n=1 Tax=Chryseobacterium rhizoplanae TaxID=1609531 RepID=UPI001CE24E2A|nr:hypothetical protein [Chryseobacterium rhizoplanae]UCA61769.1 hypothetical protein KB553_09610 [Chryseobacterium rhizoplanae]
MKDCKKYCNLFFIVAGTGLFPAQQLSDSALTTAEFDCTITQTSEKLHKKYVASTPELRLRANNQEYVYAIFRLGKSDNRVFMYIKILDENVCIKKDQVLDIQYTNGETISYKNDFHVNCDGIFVRRLNIKEMKKLSENTVSVIKVYTFRKNYEFLLNGTQNYNISNQLHCLSAYKLKRS